MLLWGPLLCEDAAGERDGAGERSDTELRCAVRHAAIGSETEMRTLMLLGRATEQKRQAVEGTLRPALGRSDICSTFASGMTQSFPHACPSSLARGRIQTSKGTKLLTSLVLVAVLLVVC